MIVLANDGIEESAKNALEALGFAVDTNKYTGEELLARLPEVDVVVIRSATTMGKEELDAGKSGKLQLVIRAGVGMDNIDARYAKEVGITATNTPAASSNAVAELALAHMLSLSRYLYISNVSMRKKKWLKNEYFGSEISGKTLGIVGIGNIGYALGEKAAALGMNVLYTNRRGDLGDAVPFAEFRSMEDLLRESDFVSLHTPKMGDRPLMGEEEIAMMKDGAYLINLARGGIVDEGALLKALDSGKLAGAGLDVYSVEPMEDERILSHEKISMTPHIGASTEEAQARIGGNIVQIVQEFYHV